MIPQSYIDELIARLDIVTVIDARVKLKKAGKHWVSCCPFHDEKSPSFAVNEAKQFYYCFGCGASGHALNFVLEFEKLEFPAAVEKLANSIGMPKWTAERQTKRSSIPASRRRRLQKILEHEEYLVKFSIASMKHSTIAATPEDKARAELAIQRIKKIKEIFANDSR